jgi:hypothetical protein
LIEQQQYNNGTTQAVTVEAVAAAIAAGAIATTVTSRVAINVELTYYGIIYNIKQTCGKPPRNIETYLWVTPKIY